MTSAPGVHPRTDAHGMIEDAPRIEGIEASHPAKTTTEEGMTGDEDQTQVIVVMTGDEVPLTTRRGMGPVSNVEIPDIGLRNASAMRQ